MIWDYGKAVLEAIMLASPEPLTVKKIAEVIGLDEKDARILVDDLRKEYQQPGRGLYVQEMAGGYVLTTRPEYAPYVEKLLAPRGKGLSHAALETLSIIAYRQPVTRAEMEGVRGVNVDRAVETLLERRLVKEMGRKESPGRPMLFGTTNEFLQYFGLNALSDLPPMAIDTSEAGLIQQRAAKEEGAQEIASAAEDSSQAS